MRLLALVGLFGCDAVYGLHDRPHVDAQDIDVAVPDDAIEIDAPLGCPAFAPPTFAGPPVFLLSNCNSYTTSAPANMALVQCNGAFFESPIATSNMVAAIVNIEQDQTLADPRLAPSGEEMFVTSRTTSGGGRSIRTYRRAGGQWNIVGRPVGLPTAIGSSPLFASTPSEPQQPGGRRIIIHRVVVATPQFSEYAEESSGWTLVRDYTATDLDVSTFAYPSLSPDGRQLVFTANPTGGGTAEVHYARRASIADSFDTSVKLEIGVDNAQYPHLESDCSRLYFTGTTTVQYVHP